MPASSRYDEWSHHPSSGALASVRMVRHVVPKTMLLFAPLSLSSKETGVLIFVVAVVTVVGSEYDSVFMILV